MRKNILLLAATIVAGVILLAIKPLFAQDAPQAAPAPASPPVGQPPPGGPMRQGLPPGAFPGPGMRGRPGGSYFITLRYLRMSKVELERSTDDFNGHRKTALDAVNKAIEELTIVQREAQAAAQARAIAARNAAAQNGQAPATGGPLQAPTQNPAPAPNSQQPGVVPPTQSQ